jgi:hypothetical protein
MSARALRSNAREVRRSGAATLRVYLLGGLSPEPEGVPISFTLCTACMPCTASASHAAWYLNACSFIHRSKAPPSAIHRFPDGRTI